MDDLIKCIDAKQKELADIEQKMRDLATRKAEILESLRSATTRIEEIVEAAKAKPVATPISTVEGLDKHTRECLTKVGIEFLEDIAKMTKSDVQNIPLLGSNGLTQICEALRARGLSFAT